MEYFIHWAGFVGAWLLVAGPLFQAAVELRDEEFDNQAFDSLTKDLPKPDPISNWWWLLPPVAFFKNRRRNNAYQVSVMRALAPDQRAKMVGFMNKASGWFYVAAGAFLIFLKEAWELTELSGWPIFIYWVIVVVLAIAAIANTVARLMQAENALHLDDPEYREKQRAAKTEALAHAKARRKPVS